MSTRRRRASRPIELQIRVLCQAWRAEDSSVAETIQVEKFGALRESYLFTELLNGHSPSVP